MAVAQFGLSHVDRALVVRNHHRDEIPVDVAGGLHGHVVHHLRHGGVVFRQERFIGLERGLAAVRSRWRQGARRVPQQRGFRRRQLVAQGRPHGCDFLELLGDNFLSDTEKLLVVTVAKLGLSHVDRALMVRDHHGHKVAVDVPGRLDRHIVHHLGHGGIVLVDEGPLFGEAG